MKTCDITDLLISAFVLTQNQQFISNINGQIVIIDLHFVVVFLQIVMLFVY